MDSITFRQAFVGITILRDEANERVNQSRGAGGGEYLAAIVAKDAYQTALNILSNVK